MNGTRREINRADHAGKILEAAMNDIETSTGSVGYDDLLTFVYNKVRTAKAAAPISPKVRQAMLRTAVALVNQLVD